MKSNHWFIKLVVIVAALSLIITALAPLVYLIAPEVNAPDPAYEEGTVIGDLIPDLPAADEGGDTAQ